MKKINKLFLGLASAGAVAAPIATVISCGTADASIAPATTAMVTDGGSKDDKSFNEQAWNALKEINSNASETKNYLKSASYQSGDIANSYETIAGTGMKTILAAGYSHIDAIKAFNGKFGTDSLNFILVDGEVKAPNVASVTFNIKQVGFRAGYMASEYLMKKDGSRDHKVGTFGGGNFPGVTDFMTGFVAGVKYFDNQNAATLNHKVTFARLTSDDAYTNTGFAPGGGDSAATVLLDDGAEVILPVSAPQTAGVINVIKTGKHKDADIKVIGVDVDQSQTLASDASFFLTSILKNVKKALVDAFHKGHEALGHTLAGALDNGLVGLAPAQSSDAVAAAAKTKAEDTSVVSFSAIAQATDNYTWSQALSDLKNL